MGHTSSQSLGLPICKLTWPIQRFLHPLQHSLSAQILLQGIITFQHALWLRSRLKGLDEGWWVSEAQHSTESWGLCHPSGTQKSLTAPAQCLLAPRIFPTLQSLPLQEPLCPAEPIPCPKPATWASQACLWIPGLWDLIPRTHKTEGMTVGLDGQVGNLSPPKWMGPVWPSNRGDPHPSTHLWKLQDWGCLLSGSQVLLRTSWVDNCLNL